MKLSSINNIPKFLLLAFLSFSCSSDLDFNQVDDLKLEPVFVANLTYFDVPANAFVDNGNEQSVIFDAQDFNPFKNSILRDDLVKAEFDFEITNTITRAYRIDLNLINKNNQNIETLTFNVPAYSGTANTHNFSEIFENQRLVLLKTTAKISFAITMAPGPPLTETSPGNLKLRSGATLYLEIEDLK
jgi:hypothetical protein